VTDIRQFSLILWRKETLIGLVALALTGLPGRSFAGQSQKRSPVWISIPESRARLHTPYCQMRLIPLAPADSVRFIQMIPISGSAQSFLAIHRRRVASWLPESVQTAHKR